MARSAPRSRWLAYLFSLLGIVAMAGLYFLIHRKAPDGSIAIIFVPAIIFAAYLGGLGPALMAAVLSCLGEGYFLLSSVGSFPMVAGPESWRLFCLLLTGVAAGAIGDARHRSAQGGRARAQLREYEKILDGLEEMIAVIDRDYRVVLANRTYCSFRDMERAQVLGRSLADLLHKEEFENVVKQKLDECFKGEPVKYELRYRYPHRGDRDLLISYFPVEGPTGIDRVACVLEDVTDRKQAEKHLQASHVELRSLTTDLRTAREDEAVRISREIHDQLGQALTGVQMDVMSLRRVLEKRRHSRDQTQTLSKLNMISEEVEKTLQIARRVATELRPAVLDTLGLAAAIEWKTREFEERSSIFCNLTLPEGSLDLDSERSTAVFRIFEEVLTNIVRHARATEVSVILRTSAETIVLEVSDNGVGIERKTSHPESHGLLGIQERALAAGIIVNLTSEPGEGTMTTIEIPTGGMA